MTLPNQLQKPDFEGYLVKQSTWLREWRRRYFTLRGNKLYYSKSPEDPPHGCVDLKDCLTVRSAEEVTGKPNSFEVATPAEVLYLYADSEARKDEWIGAIGRAIVRFSSAYTGEDGFDA
jgi:hypothetical protein